MSAKRLSSKGVRRNVSSVDSSRNLRVVLSERKDPTTKNLVTATAQRLFSKSGKNEKENVSQSRSKSELVDRSKESKSSGRKASGTLCPVSPKNGKTESVPGGRKTTVSTTKETAGGLSNRPKPDENNPDSSSNNSRQNAKLPLDSQTNSSKLSQPSLGKTKQSAGPSEPKLRSASERSTSNKLVERVNGISRTMVERHSTKSLASKSKILSGISQNLSRSTSTMFSVKKSLVKRASAAVTVRETPLPTNARSVSSLEVDESLKQSVTSLTKSTGQDAVNCDCPVERVSSCSFLRKDAATRFDYASESDLISNLNITRCMSVDSSTCEGIGLCETAHNVKNGLHASGKTLNFYVLPVVWGSKTKWYGQNGTDKMAPIESSINQAIQLPLTM